MIKLDFYGSIEKQSVDIKEIEKDLFFRKVVLIGYFAKELEKYNVKTFIQEINEDYKKVSFVFEHKNSKKGGIFHFIANLKDYEIEDVEKFINFNNEAINAVFYVEDLLENSYEIKKIEKSNNTLINDTNFKWIELVFDYAEKKELKSEFVAKIINNDLIEKKIKKDLKKI